MSSSNSIMFTAEFLKYERTEILKQKSHFKNIRTRDGSIVSKLHVFDEDITSKIQGHLTLGEYVAFVADVDFKNIEFQYPHAPYNKDDLIGSSH